MYQILRSIFFLSLTMAYTCSAFAKDVPLLGKNKVIVFNSGLPAILQSHVEIQSKGLVGVPEVLCNIRNVVYFNLQSNEIASIPACIKNHALSLENLLLSNNKLKTLPREIGFLKRVREFEFKNNLLETLPTEIGNMRAVTKIDLSGNKLRSLPASMGDLANLDHLNLSDNKLENLPFELARLTRLKTLDLSRNKLSRAPEFLPYLVNLTRLSLSGNPLSVGQKEAIKAVFSGTKTKLEF